jgi:hypothetical protein
MRLRTLWLAAAAALAGACSSGGGGTGVPGSLAGEWKVWLTLNGQEIGPYATCFDQSGVTLDGVGISGTVIGNNFTVTNDDLAGLEVVFTGTVAGSFAAGALTISGTSIVGTFRMEAFAPVGSLAMTGTVNGTSAAAQGTTASGRREYTDQGQTQLDNVEVCLDDGIVRVHLTFDATGLGLGTLAVGGGGVTANLSHETDGAVIDETATGGSVTITRYDGSGMAGTYTLQFAGGSVSGSFDVAWDLEAFEPP